MNRSSSNQSQSHSTGHSYTNYGDSDEPEVVRICKCGHDLVVRTSWTNSNPGRHFRSCSADAGNQCGVFEWIDPPMCRRSIEVIPGLLKRLNSQEKQLKDYGQKLRGLEASLDGIYALSSWRDCWMCYNTSTPHSLYSDNDPVHILKFPAMAGDGFHWQNKMFYCEHWTPEIEDTFIQSLLAHHRKGTFHHDLVVVEWDPKKNIISADTYVWEQIAKFDRGGTCLDDEWVTNKAPPADDSYGDSSFGNDHDVEQEEPSWWAFVQEYYASDSGTGSVNTHTRTIRRPATSGFATPPPQSPIKDVNTPSSVASNDPDIEDNSPSPYIPKYLRRRQPKKPKF
ncbi:hypothetical protein Salat_1224900 [Sesamum alatum]|uniref:GRF-type domain-containing protein n=1 Tax=Sesamum alatum TaxID=300844 RepID=A0AAE2CP18_9LAMI|nr:hypothetical protein Salat_1224900 [Sesamum alatum]